MVVLQDALSVAWRGVQRVNQVLGEYTNRVHRDANTKEGGNQRSD